MIEMADENTEEPADEARATLVDTFVYNKVSVPVVDYKGQTCIPLRSFGMCFNWSNQGQRLVYTVYYKNENENEDEAYGEEEGFFYVDWDFVEQKILDSSSVKLQSKAFPCVLITLDGMDLLFECGYRKLKGENEDKYKEFRQEVGRLFDIGEAANQLDKEDPILPDPATMQGPDGLEFELHLDPPQGPVIPAFPPYEYADSFDTTVDRLHSKLKEAHVCRCKQDKDGVGKCKNGPNTQEQIRAGLLELADFLCKKNEAYGDSALKPMRIFSRASETSQLENRIDDKLSRIAYGKEYPGDNDVRDLTGYLILYMIAGDIPFGEE